MRTAASGGTICTFPPVAPCFNQMLYLSPSLSAYATVRPSGEIAAPVALPLSVTRLMRAFVRSNGGPVSGRVPMVTTPATATAMTAIPPATSAASIRRERGRRQGRGAGAAGPDGGSPGPAAVTTSFGTPVNR